MSGFRFDLKSREVVQVSEIRPNAMIGFEHRSNCFWVIGIDGELSLVDVVANKTIEQRKIELTGLGRSLVSLENGTRVAACSQNGDVVIASTEDGSTIAAMKTKLDFFCTLHPSLDGKSVFIPTHEGAVIQLASQGQINSKRYPVEMAESYDAVPIDELGRVLLAQSAGLYFLKIAGEE